MNLLDRHLYALGARLVRRVGHLVPDVQGIIMMLCGYCKEMRVLTCSSVEALKHTAISVAAIGSLAKEIAPIGNTDLWSDHYDSAMARPVMRSLQEDGHRRSSVDLPAGHCKP